MKNITSFQSVRTLKNFYDWEDSTNYNILFSAVSSQTILWETNFDFHAKTHLRTCLIPDSTSFEILCLDSLLITGPKSVPGS